MASMHLASGYLRGICVSIRFLGETPSAQPLMGFVPRAAGMVLLLHQSASHSALP